MKIVVGVVMSREFSQFHTKAVYAFRDMLSEWLLEFKSDIIKEIITVR